MSRRSRLTQRPALCCECGTIRPTSAIGSSTSVGRSDGEDASGTRIVMRRCATCRTQTQHAYLLVEDRDDRPGPPPTPTRSDQPAEAELLALETDAARRRGVKVLDRPVTDRLVAVSQDLEDGTWAVSLDSRAPARRRRLGLRTALQVIDDEREHTWLVEPADPDQDQPATRFAIFALPDRA